MVKKNYLKLEKTKQEVDIAEDEFLKKYPEVFSILLKDKTTNKNIFWATDNYQYLGDEYHFFSRIRIELITGKNNKVIMPRVLKNKTLQNIRIKNMAEVYTPAWICNAQNNQIDNTWFQRKDVFNNEEIDSSDSGLKWKTNYEKIIFPKNKTWKDYIKDRRLEIACGEAPYITSRYDTTTGKFIPVKERIGMLDRKLRVINENVSSSKEWIDIAQIAYQSVYAYEWQGDSLLLAREAMLYTFIENYILKFKKKPTLKSIKNIANIISWNVWQMDGLKGIIPNSCKEEHVAATNIFKEKIIKNLGCLGCINNNIEKHNGIYCVIKDWSANDRKGRDIKFLELLKN